MFPNNADQFVEFKRQELIAEADHERLLAQVPHTSNSRVRHGLAHACYRVANWLDGEWYARPAESGPEDWVRESSPA